MGELYSAIQLYKNRIITEINMSFLNLVLEDDNNDSKPEVDRNLLARFFDKALTSIQDDSDSKFDVKKYLIGIVRSDKGGKGQRDQDIRALISLLVNNSELAGDVFNVFNDRAKVLANDVLNNILKFIRKLPDDKLAEHEAAISRLLTSITVNGVYRTLWFGIPDDQYGKSKLDPEAMMKKLESTLEKKIAKTTKDFEKKLAEKQEKMFEGVTEKMTTTLDKMFEKFLG